MLTIRYERGFKKDYKRIVKRNYDVSLLENVIDLLANEEQLPQQYRDHALTGSLEGLRECHILNNWLLVYRIDRNELILGLTRTGTHGDIFG